MVKNPTTSAEDPRYLGSIPRSGKIPWRRKWQPTPVFLPGGSHDQRSLAGYSPWGHRELVMTEHIHMNALGVYDIGSSVVTNRPL